MKSLVKARPQGGGGHSSASSLVLGIKFKTIRTQVQVQVSRVNIEMGGLGGGRVKAGQYGGTAAMLYVASNVSSTLNTEDWIGNWTNGDKKLLVMYLLMTFSQI